MKLLHKIILICILISIASIYIFIPNNIKISKNIRVKSGNNLIFKFFQNPNSRSRWWPDKHHNNAKINSTNSFKKATFMIGSGYLEFIPIKVIINNLELPTSLTLVSISVDSTVIQWETSIQTSYNPIKRLLQYNQAVELHANFTELLHIFKIFIENDLKVYGLAIRFGNVTNPILLTTKFRSSSYPSSQMIYNSINLLKATIKTKGVIQTDSPMLNISTQTATHYEIQTAIPINKEFQITGHQIIKRMVLGRVLETRVVGGPHRLTNAMQELENFLQDNRLVSPAIPYQSLVTNRLVVRDSSKWVTQIFYPIY